MLIYVRDSRGAMKSSEANLKIQHQQMQKDIERAIRRANDADIDQLSLPELR